MVKFSISSSQQHVHIDYWEMFDNADDIAHHLLKPKAEQDKLEAEWLEKTGRASMACDLNKAPGASGGVPGKEDPGPEWTRSIHHDFDALRESAPRQSDPQTKIGLKPAVIQILLQNQGLEAASNVVDNWLSSLRGMMVYANESEGRLIRQTLQAVASAQLELARIKTNQDRNVPADRT